MDPAVLAAIISIVGGLAGQAMKSQDATAGMGNRDINASRSNDFFARLAQSGGAMNPDSWYNQSKSYMGQAGQSQGQAAQMAQRSSQDILAQLAQQQPQVQQQAASAAQGATSKSGSSLMDLAAAASAAARNNLESRLAGSGQGLYQGGALKALSQGAQMPLLQAQAQGDQLYSQAYQNAYGSLAGLGQQREYSRPSELSAIATGYGNLGAQTGNLGAQLAALLGGQSEQMMVAPQFVGSQSFAGKAGDVGLGALANILGQRTENPSPATAQLGTLQGTATGGADTSAENLSKYFDSNRAHMSTQEQQAFLNALRNLGYSY